MALQGVLLVDKPSGWTSFDVVNYVRKQIAAVDGTKPKNTKVGHIGTLDPLATGLLVLLVGKEYTRRATDLSKLDKIYDVTMRLGQTSTTGDDEGAKMIVSDTAPTHTAVLEALDRFQGQLQQTPPAYSAIKVDGVRAYKLAREGAEVNLAPRPVTIYRNDLSLYDYPFVRFTSHVGSGTYIRSLVEDIGRELDSGAFMSDLRRMRVGNFMLDEAVPPDHPELLGRLFSL